MSVFIPRLASFSIGTPDGIRRVLLLAAVPVGAVVPSKSRWYTVCVNPKTDMGALLKARGWWFA